MSDWGVWMKKKLINQFFRLLIVLFSTVCIVLLIKYAFTYLYPFVLAIFISLLLNPFVSLLEKKFGFPRTLATIAAIITTFIMLLGLFAFAIIEFIQGTAYLAKTLPEHLKIFFSFAEEIFQEHILPFYHKLISFFHAMNPKQQEALGNGVEELSNRIAMSITAFLQGILTNIPAALLWLPSSAAIVMVIFLATFFITKDWHDLHRKAKKILPIVYRPVTNRIWEHVKKALIGFMKAQLILLIITACVIYIGLLILNVEYAFTISMLAAAVDLIPYLGTSLIFIPWILYLFLAGDYTMTIGLSILFMVIVAGRQVLEPKVLSDAVGLNPLGILVALFVGGQLWGFAGMMIAPVCLVLLQAFYRSGVFGQIWEFIKG